MSTLTRRGLGRQRRKDARREALAGVHLLEVSVAMTVTLLILLGIMASISTASATEMRATESTASQMLLGQTVEETKNVAFDSLSSLNGQYVTSGSVRADISVSFVTLDLVRVQITTSSTIFPEVTHRAILLQANLE